MFLSYLRLFGIQLCGLVHVGIFTVLIFALDSSSILFGVFALSVLFHLHIFALDFRYLSVFAHVISSFPLPYSKNPHIRT